MSDGVYLIGRKNSWHARLVVIDGVAICTALPFADFHFVPAAVCLVLLTERNLYHKLKTEPDERV